jgi:hypothetical protein
MCFTYWLQTRFLFNQSKMLCDFLITKAHAEFTEFYCNFSAASLHTVGFHCALSSLSLADDYMPKKGDNTRSPSNV